MNKNDVITNIYVLLDWYGYRLVIMWLILSDKPLKSSKYDR